MEKIDERSNFVALLEFRSECDEALKSHLESSSANARYTSHRIQNELIDLCGNQLQKEIVDDCKSANYYSEL